MSLLSLIAALLLEQLHPLSSRKHLSAWLNGYVHFFQEHLNAGEHKHGQIAWLVAVLLPVLASVLVYWLLYRVHPIFAWIFCVAVLYLTLGFRQVSHYFTDIHEALRDDSLEKARGLLSTWRGIHNHELNAAEVARIAIEESLLASHRRIFGVMTFFVITMLLGLGPSGAVLYRMALFLDTRWGQQDNSEFGAFGSFARKMRYWIDWLPVRLTAITFAIVGDFEDTVYCWRTQAKTWPDPEAGIVLASGAGALGVRLGLPIPQGGLPLDRPEMGIGEEADADFMQSTVGLVWRALIFWLVLLALLELATLVGS
ncbi:MAG: CobD/CbiB family protein [Pseudomonadota bacterium]